MAEGSRQIELHIERLGYGRGAVARAEGRVVFVEAAAPGDHVLADITREHQTFAEATVSKLLQAGPSRVPRPCPVAARCGGCPWQQVSYEEQCEAKRQAVIDSIERIAGVAQPPVEPLIPSPRQFGYRNRIKLRFHGGRMGFYSARSHALVAIDDCMLAEETIRKALPEVESFVRSLATQTVRVEVLSRGELGGLVVLLNSQGRLKHTDTQRVHDYLTASDKHPVRGVVIWGRGWKRSWGDSRRRFRVDREGTQVETRGTGFAQVNTQANRLLVQALVESASQGIAGTALDLYAGAGNFALPLARFCRRVIAIDSEIDAVDSGRRSAAKQKLDNVEFRLSRADLAAGRWTGSRPDLVVVDPPRSGLGKAAQTIAGLGARKLLVVSCNPPVLARDLRPLLEAGYRLERVVPIDLFPQTFHVEALCCLELT